MNTALSTAATATAGAGGALRRGAATADALYSAYRAEYCAPAVYIPSTRMPANFTSELGGEREMEKERERKAFRAQKTPTSTSHLFSFHFSPSIETNPLSHTGPGFSLTFSLGNCSLAMNPGSFCCLFFL